MTETDYIARRESLVAAIEHASDSLGKVTEANAIETINRTIGRLRAALERLDQEWQAQTK